MHVYFSGIGGTAIGPLALIAKQAGFEVSGSDKQDSQYIQYLRKHGITNIHIGQDRQAIAAVHDDKPIDWFVYTSALPLENPDAPELQFCTDFGIKTSKRDELLNLILQEKGLKLIAIAGTHGKTTTTAMATWLFKQLGLPLSYSVGAKIPFGEMGQYETESEYFVYEADEFDRNFLAFEPHMSLITGVSWDHHEVFPTREDYQEAFREFISQSQHTYVWQEDADYLGLEDNDVTTVLDSSDRRIKNIRLLGLYNRLDAWLVAQAVQRITGQPLDKLLGHLSDFPGLSRRMEQLATNLYTDYAHTPEKIRGAMSVATEMAADKGQKVVVVYEPLTNRRQHYMLDDYKDCFSGADKIYWVPSYLAREDPNQRIISPEELINHLADPHMAMPADMDENLKHKIQHHLNEGDLVIGMGGGGGNSLDEWLRKEFTA
ncbi:MAG TPA: Mur ligase domain-containing protein [Candidatus Saccharimonadales bacterium]|nr:Mur ligase domain-containing protein [Candidatus Saccharimonadales bacterium]